MSSSADHIPPAASTFSFTAPSSPALTPPLSALKQRRVSLALPSSPRLVQAWSFRDDTGIDSHTAGGSTRRGGLVPEKRGKMRKIASGSDSAAPLHDDPADEAAAGIFQEKKQRKKWTQEETQMLVDGCNRVSGSDCVCGTVLTVLFETAWGRELEDDTQRPDAHV